MKAYIVRFLNQISVHEFDVIVNHSDCTEATLWARGYFDDGSYRIEYVESDFEGNHTFRRASRVSL
jgi:hypothetical protein